MTIRSTVLTACVALGLLIGAGCAAPLRTTVTPFRPPESYPSSTRIEGLVLAVDPVDTEEHSTRVFGTDLRTAEVLPLHLIARNTGSHEFEINAAQIFGMTAGGEFAGAYTLHQASQRVRDLRSGPRPQRASLLGRWPGLLPEPQLEAQLAEERGPLPERRSAGRLVGLAVSRKGPPIPLHRDSSEN